MTVKRALTAVLAVGLLAGAAPAAHAAPKLPLSHAGRWITDASGRVVVLHGMNMVYKRPPYAPDAVGFGDDDAAFLAAEGYDSVRLGVIYEAVEPQPGRYDDAYLARIADTIHTLGRHGITSVVDFHQDSYSERFSGEGFPDWAVQDDGLPNKPDFGFGPNYLLMPALQRAFDHFWRNDPGPGGVGLQDRYAAAWQHVAARFKDDKYVLGYELLNEPWPGTEWQACASPLGCPGFDDVLTRFTRRMVGAIREVDPRTPILYEPNVIFNDSPDTRMGKIDDPQLIFSFHDYCLTSDVLPIPGGKALCPAFDDQVFHNAEKRSAHTGDALLLTEFGATDDAQTLRDMVERADRTMVGWQEWHYCGCDDPTTSGPGATQAIVLDPSKPPVGANLKAAKLKILSRPYPRVVAGTPRAYGFDARTSTFTLDYDTAKAAGRGRFGRGGATEVVLPARQYPAGYTARVQGAAIRSRRDARVLRLSARRGAERVKVSVTPR
jgi:endoglycosylceramidase